MEEQDDVYPLDDYTISMLAELKAQQAAVQANFQFVLGHFVKSHKLQGVWQLAENGREVILQKTPATRQ